MAGSGENKRYGRTFQALYSYQLAFTFPTDAGALDYLRGSGLHRGRTVHFPGGKYFPAAGSSYKIPVKLSGRL